MKKLHPKLIEYLACKQKYMPALILVCPDFGIHQKLFFNVYKKLNSAKYFEKIPENLSDLISETHVIICTNSLETIFKPLAHLSESEIDSIQQKLWVIELNEPFTDEDELFKELSSIKKTNHTITSYSRNISDFIHIGKSPEWFIKTIFAKVNQIDTSPYKESCIFTRHGKYLINIPMLYKDWEKVFGFRCPFSEQELSKYVRSISVRSDTFTKINNGKKYRIVDSRILDT